MLKFLDNYTFLITHTTLMVARKFMEALISFRLNFTDSFGTYIFNMPRQLIEINLVNN